MYAVTTSSVGNPFSRIDFNPERHAYLEGLKFADKYPSTGEREFEMIVSEPYFSELERAEEVKSPNPSLPMAKLTALGWILRGAFGVSRQLRFFLSCVFSSNREGTKGEASVNVL